jgi:hypothetical protein
VDKLYKTVTGGTAPAGAIGGEGGAPPPPGGDFGGGAPPPPAEAPPAGGEGAVTPESVKKDMNIILERDNIYGVDDIDLEKGSRSLGVIEESLRKLID